MQSTAQEEARDSRRVRG